MVFITGASSGIGEACAVAFARYGRSLWLSARRVDRLQRLAGRLHSEFGIDVICSRLDVCDRKAVEGFFKAERERLNKVSVLLNNAGLARGLDDIQSGNIDDWEEVIDTNVKGVLYLTRGFLPIFLKAGLGHIINIGSVAGRWTYAKGNVYCATKRAVSSLTEGMRIDLLGTPIRVTEVAPGLVESEFSLVRFRGDKRRAESVYSAVRCLKPEDVAEAVIWAAGRPAHVNVQELVIYPTDQASTNHLHRHPGNESPQE